MKLLNVCRSTIRALNRRVSLGSLAIRTCHCDACDTCDARCWRHAQAGEAVFAEIGMLQGLAGRDTLARMEDQHFLEKNEFLFYFKFVSTDNVLFILEFTNDKNDV